MRVKLGYQPALDGLRGVAIALVVVSHVHWVPGGFLGVDVFFVLSGFLITTLLLEEWGRTGTIRLRAFYLRRARRLLPALLALLGILALLATAAATSGDTTIARAWSTSIAACLLYMANIWRATGHPLIGPLTQMWSLAEEEQFYLVWPPILVLLLRRRVGLRGLAVGLGTAALAVMVWRAHLGPGNRTYFSPDTRCDPLLIGCLLGVLRYGRMLPRVPAGIGVLACAALAGDVAVATIDDFTDIVGFPVAGLATATVIAAALQGSWLTRLLSFRPLVGLGVISYSLYIWQGLGFSIQGVPGGRTTEILPTVFVAWLSYRYVEQPFRRRRAPASAAAVPEVAHSYAAG
jgi:peptidoglycan/LPS O-acetylase OafA/YrhL